MEVERLSADGLSREVWRFSVFSPRFGSASRVDIALGYYGKEVRASTRHKFKPEAQSRWSFDDQRRYNSGISASEVPLPDDVKQQAIQQLHIAVHGADADRRGF